MYDKRNVTTYELFETEARINIFVCNSLPTANKTPFTIKKNNCLMPFKEVIAVYFERHTKLTDTMFADVYR
jgi:hypothetical protein